MASSRSSVTFRPKGSICGNTGLSISDSSGVGLSEKLEQLESPLSVSDLSGFTRPDECFIFCSIFSRYKSYCYDLGNQELEFFFTFSVISYLFHFIIIVALQPKVEGPLAR